MGLIIDTSVLVQLEREHRSPVTLASQVEEVAVAAITVAELRVGLLRAQTDQQSQLRQAFLSSVVTALPVLPFDTQAAEVYADLWAQLSSQGNLIGVHDLLIAATAMSNDYGVLTSNLRDFQRIPDLNVRQPSW